MPLIRICEAKEPAAEAGFAGTVSIDEGPDHSISIRSPFDESQEQDLDWYFEEHLRRPFLNQVRAARIAQCLGGYGESLFQQIFVAPQAYAAYVQQRNQLDQLRIEIEGTPAFHALHWEALKDPALPQPLALQVPIVRRLRVEQAMPAAMRAAPALRLLIVTARPRGRGDVGYRTISRPLVEALRKSKARVDIDILRPGTYKALDQHLTQVRDDPQRGVGFYHVIHFDTHGALLTHEQLQSTEDPADHLSYRRYGRADIAPYAGQKAFVFLEAEQGETADPVEAGELATLLTTHQIPITVLNACQSGKQVGDSETSLGSRLLQAGVQLVLAMGYSITVTAAQRLMSSLYEQLFDGAEIATAIRRGRRELYNDKQRQAYFNQRIELEDWLLPVVYQNREVRIARRELSEQESRVYYQRQASSVAEPQTTYGFFGRDLEVLEIERRLLRHNLLLVHGMGGAGKTTLLKHLAHWWQGTDFVNEVFYFGYDTQGWSRQQIMSEIAIKLLGKARYYGEFEPLSEPAQQALLAERLRGERHLVMLDNLESITGTHLAIAHGLAQSERTALQSWLASLSGGRTLVLLGSRSEEAWLAPGTFAGNRYELQGLDGEAASNLAEVILERAAPTKARSYRADADFAALLTLLAGFPLALQVILSNLARQTPSEVLEALRAGDAQLDKPAGKDKTQSILQCVDYAYGRLDADAQALLRCLAPFSGVINTSCLPQYIEQLRQHAELAQLPFERLSEVLGTATKGGLVAPDSTMPGLLRVQPVLPYFLRGRLTEAGAEPARAGIEAAYRALYAAYAGELRQAMGSQDPTQRQSGQVLMAVEYENVLQALQLGLTARASILDCYSALSDHFNHTHAEEAGRNLGHYVLARLEEYPAQVLTGPLGLELVIVIWDVATRDLTLREFEDARLAYERALSLLQSNTARSVEWRQKAHAGLYHQLGRVAQEQRDWPQAEQYYQKALAIYIDLNDRHSQASTLHNLGVVAQAQRDWPQAEQYYQKALAIMIDFNDRHSQARTLGGLGRVMQAQRDWPQAEQYYQKALAIYVDFNDRHSQAITLHSLGIVAQEQRDWPQAEQYYQKALAIMIDFNDRHSQAGTLHQLGSVAQEQRDWPQAEQYYQKALAIMIDFNDRHSQASTLHQLGSVAQAQRDWPQAEQYYQKALAIKIDFNDRHSQASTLHQLGSVAEEQSDHMLAIDFLFKALAIWSEFKDQHHFAISLHAISEIWKHTGDSAIPKRLAALLDIDTTQAEARLRQVLGEDPSDKQVTEA